MADVVSEGGWVCPQYQPLVVIFIPLGQGSFAWQPTGDGSHCLEDPFFSVPLLDLCPTSQVPAASSEMSVGPPTVLTQVCRSTMVAYLPPRAKPGRWSRPISGHLTEGRAEK